MLVLHNHLSSFTHFAPCTREDPRGSWSSLAALPACRLAVVLFAKDGAVHGQRIKGRLRLSVDDEGALRLLCHALPAKQQSSCMCSGRGGTGRCAELVHMQVCAVYSPAKKHKKGEGRAGLRWSLVVERAAPCRPAGAAAVQLVGCGAHCQ